MVDPIITPIIICIAALVNFLIGGVAIGVDKYDSHKREKKIEKRKKEITNFRKRYFWVCARQVSPYIYRVLAKFLNENANTLNARGIIDIPIDEGINVPMAQAPIFDTDDKFDYHQETIRLPNQRISMKVWFGYAGGEIKCMFEKMDDRNYFREHFIKIGREEKHSQAEAAQAQASAHPHGAPIPQISTQQFQSSTSIEQSQPALRSFASGRDDIPLLRRRIVKKD